MKKQFLLLAVCSLYAALSFAQKNTKDMQDVNALIQKMTLEEKIGQMTQLTLGTISKDGITADPEMMRKALVQYQVGSILNVGDHAITVDQWRKLITQIQDETKKTRLKIPCLYGLDAIHGQTYTLDATLFPQNIAMAATRNPELVSAISKVTAKELRASGVRWNFAPVLDMGRQQLWSRFPETYGEDVYLTKTMGVAAIKAYEGDGLMQPTAVASCMKHYLGYSASRTGKDRTPIYMPEIEMREYYLPPFAAAVKAGASTIMINSSDINGTPVHASKYLLTDVLRKELGFEGVAVTDWEDIIRLYDIHKVAATPREAVVMAVNAGIDMSMVPMNYSFPDLLKEAVQKKEVSMARIDEAVRRILLLKMKLGLFANPYPENNTGNFGQSEYATLALDAAHEAITLLKNNKNILPLNKTTKVLIAGPAAQSISALNGCWSYTWQGKNEQWYPANSKTIAQAITEKTGAENVIIAGAKGFSDAANFSTDNIVNNAAKADVIVLCIGEDAHAESPGNTRDLALPDEQVSLVKAAAGTGKPVILVLAEGRPRLITNIDLLVQGVIMAYWSGSKTAEALADIIFGDYNPSGKLPFSYCRSMGEMVMYDRKPTEEKREILNENVTWNGYDPLYPFGWGLSYTTFEYSNLQLSTTHLSGNQKLKVSVTVKNSGSRDGKHSVELYTHDLYASIVPSVHRLRAFQKIFLKVGESKTVTFELDKTDLAFVNAQLKTVTEPGDFEVMVGNLKAGFKYAQQQL